METASIRIRFENNKIERSIGFDPFRDRSKESEEEGSTDFFAGHPYKTTYPRQTAGHAGGALMQNQTASGEDFSPLGAILAGGRGQRMGGRKALVPFLGRPLIAHAAERLRTQCRKIIVNANDDFDALTPYGDAVIADSVADFPGPLAGVSAALDFARTSGTCADVLIAPCDTPFLPLDLVRRLNYARKNALTQIALARSRGRVHWTIALLPCGMADDLREALKMRTRKMQNFFQSYAVAYCDFDADYDPFFNINSPEDLVVAQDLRHERF